MKNTTLSLFFISCIFLSSLVWSAEKTSAYKLPITRNGKTVSRVAYNYWSGEYPQPIIDVNATQKGTTKITAYKSLRTLDEPVTCTIPNGIYHPWSETKPPVINYYSLANTDDYKALDDVILDGEPLKKDELLTNVVYGSEGYCVGNLRNKDIVFRCEDLLDNKTKLKNMTSSDEFAEQWLYLTCNEGHQAYVQDETLLKQTGVRKGSLIEYGKVGPYKKEEL